jgi:hypothetical protein
MNRSNAGNVNTASSISIRPDSTVTSPELSPEPVIPSPVSVNAVAYTSAAAGLY